MAKYTDTELLDFLQRRIDKSTYTGKVILRMSTTSRGLRLHETFREGAVRDVREAIAQAMDRWEAKDAI